MMIDLFVIISNNEEEHTVRPGVVLARATEHGVELHMSNNKIKKGVFLWREELQRPKSDKVCALFGKKFAASSFAPLWGRAAPPSLGIINK